jgi:MFS family permease
MAPAGLSLLTTSFTENRDRTRALGVWGAMSGLAAATGVFLGGVLSQGPGWRFVLLVNLPVCLLIVGVAVRLLPDDRARARIAGQDLGAAALLAAAMLALIYTLVQAPALGWGSRSIVVGLLGSAALLGAFVLAQARSSSPLFPYSLFRIRGLLAANITQLLAFAGFLSVFYFLTLYMQNVLGFSPTESGSAYLPVTAGIVLAAGAAAQLIPRVGTRPVTVVGALIAAGGVLLLSRIPLHGHYPGNLLPGLLIMSIGLGVVFVAVTTAANAGVPTDKAGLAAGLLNASLQLGSALGLAVFSAIATATTGRLLNGDVTAPQALTTGFAHALLACGVALLAAAVIAARAANTRGTASPDPDTADNAVRAPVR